MLKQEKRDETRNPFPAATRPIKKTQKPQKEPNEQTRISKQENKTTMAEEKNVQQIPLDVATQPDNSVQKVVHDLNPVNGYGKNALGFLPTCPVTDQPRLFILKNVTLSVGIGARNATKPWVLVTPDKPTWEKWSKMVDEDWKTKRMNIAKANPTDFSEFKFVPKEHLAEEFGPYHLPSVKDPQVNTKTGSLYETSALVSFKLPMRSNPNGGIDVLDIGKKLTVVGPDGTPITDPMSLNKKSANILVQAVGRPFSKEACKTEKKDQIGKYGRERFLIRMIRLTEAPEVVSEVSDNVMDLLGGADVSAPAAPAAASTKRKNNPVPTVEIGAKRKSKK